MFQEKEPIDDKGKKNLAQKILGKDKKEETAEGSSTDFKCPACGAVITVEEKQ